MEAKVKVTEAIPDDAYKGIIRVDSTLLKKIGCRPGDVVEIEGKRKTVAIADRAYPSDIGRNYIRMDGIIRKNAKTSVGDIISIRKAEIKEAVKVTIAPAREGIVVRAPARVFKQSLLGRPMVKGDVISPGGAKRRRSTMSGNPLFDEVFSMMEENLMGLGFGDLRFVVADTAPGKVPVIISENTQVILNPQAVKVKDDVAPQVNYEDIGGLQEELRKVREMVELPLKHPEIF
jgi:transitional endoplasmic reticulum ATPase